MATKTKTKPAKAVEEELDDELELDELEEDEVSDAAPAKKSKKGSQEEVAFGASQLAAYIAEKTGKKLDARGLRTLLRKMARDGSGRIEREISQDNRTRYSWSGPDDPQVKIILKAITDGELDAHKKEQLDKLKADKAKKASAAQKEKAKKAKAAVVEDDDDEDDEDDDE